MCGLTNSGTPHARAQTCRGRLGCATVPLVSDSRVIPPDPLLLPQGIYFADMVTKSANYCNANKKENTALGSALYRPPCLRVSRGSSHVEGEVRDSAIGPTSQ